MTRFREFMFGQSAARFDGMPITTSAHLPDGEVVIVQPGSYGGHRMFMVGVRPPGAPSEIARRIVREGMRDVLAWLGPNAPNMLTGREVLDRFAGRPVWSARAAEPDADGH